MMDGNNKNTILAIVLSIGIIIAWQFLYVNPKLEAERKAAELDQARQTQTEQTTSTPSEGDSGNVPQLSQLDGNVPSAAKAPSGVIQTREAAVANSERITLETKKLVGSINLKGARIDDLRLKDYRETIDDESPLIILLSPSEVDGGYFAEFGWAGSDLTGEVPGKNTEWKADKNQTLAVGSPVSLSWVNEKGIEFSRTIAIDDNYLFTIKDEVKNGTDKTISLAPYGRIGRFGTPTTEGIFVLHEGLIGVLEEKLVEVDYDDLQEEKRQNFEKTTNGWLGITDKYWATALIPSGTFAPGFSYSSGGRDYYQSDFLVDAINIAPGQTGLSEQRLFAGAKEVSVVDGYFESLKLDKFDKLIDWGYLHFITKPLFSVMDWFYELVGNFGVAILFTTVLIKLLFFPLANMSYASMAKMKKVQPEMTKIKERFGDDRAKQQQEMMALYKKEKINPAAGCWPVLIQIPVFFALYKVIYVTIEMRQAPFFGWIQDLAAPDPTSMFNLFGLLPFEVPTLLMIGVWPLLMGITMFIQMQMNPAPPDPTQAMIFKWMPIVFTFMLATFPAGLVIYWAWNNFLSILQQGTIMKRHGVKIELWDNLRGMIGKKQAE